MNMKKIVMIVGIVCLLLTQSVAVRVQAIEDQGNTKVERKETQAEKKVALKDEKPMNFLERLLRIRAMVNGTITAKTETTLTVQDKDGKSYTVNITDKTILRRKFWGKATLGEMKLGDTVNVIGKWVDGTNSSINAILIRDISIQKRAGVFFGNVQSLTSGGWVIDTIRGVETVTVTGTTKFVNRKEEVINKSDIVTGHRIRVKGLWDADAKTITDVIQVKDFTIPIKEEEATVTTTPKPTSTVTPTPTP